MAGTMENSLVRRPQGPSNRLRRVQDTLPVAKPRWLTQQTSGDHWRWALAIPTKRLRFVERQVAVINDRGSGPIRRVAIVWQMRGRREPLKVTVWRDQMLNGREDSLDAVQAWSINEAKWMFICLACNVQGDHP